MKLEIFKTKSDSLLYIRKSVRKNNKISTVNIMKCGKLSELEKIYSDPIAHFTQLATEMTLDEKTNSELTIKYSTTKKINSDLEVLHNAGYLFLKDIYYSLNLDKFCEDISSKLKIKYDLNDILEKLIYSRILFPSSKLSTFELSKKFLEQPSFELHDIYRALDVLCDNLDELQSFVYQQSEKVIKRNTNVLYYDVTNFFFEIEQEDGFRNYGISKEHRPLPIVQMGLFTDGNGIPLAFCITNGSDNEQISLKPLEKTIIDKFKLSKFIVCTDAGLNSYNNKHFNTINNRAFISTQPIKKLKKYLQDWIFEDNDWNSFDGCKVSISDIDSESNQIFHKSRWINDEGCITLSNGDSTKTTIDQKIIVSYSPLYKRYQQTIRNNQIERAQKMISSPSKYYRRNLNDFKRFIKNLKITKNGEVAEDTLLELNYEVIIEESKYDGYYALVTNLDEDDSEIVRINHNRWQIEENFRIMKSELKSRPVYLTNENRIKAHFLTCFLALTLYRILEYKLDKKYSCHEIISALKDIQLFSLKDLGYAPAYKKTGLITHIQEMFGIELDSEAITKSKLRKIILKSKK